MRNHTTHTRDAALHQLSRINRWLIAGSIVLTGVFAEVAAHAFPGKTAKARARLPSTARPPNRRRDPRAPANSRSPRPSQAPEGSTARSRAVAGIGALHRTRPQ